MLQEVHRERVSIAATVIFALVFALSVMVTAPALQSNVSSFFLGNQILSIKLNLTYYGIRCSFMYNVFNTQGRRWLL